MITEFQKLKDRINSMDRPFENYDLCGCNDINEIIENEFGKEAVNQISHEDFLDMI